MKQRAEKIELTFGKNDADIYRWILEQDLSKATFIKRILREKMYGMEYTKPVVMNEWQPETVSEMDHQEEKPSFGFVSNMGEGRDF